MLGYSFIGDNGDDNIRDIYLYGFGVDYGLTESFHIVSEINGNRHPDRESDEDPISALFGSIFKINENILLDSGIKFGLNEAAPEWNFSLGTSITF